MNNFINRSHRCPECNETLHLHSMRNDLLIRMDRNVYCPTPGCDVSGPSAGDEDDALRLFYMKYPKPGFAFSVASDPESWDIETGELYNEVLQRLETGI